MDSRDEISHQSNKYEVKKYGHGARHGADCCRAFRRVQCCFFFFVLRKRITDV